MIGHRCIINWKNIILQNKTPSKPYFNCDSFSTSLLIWNRHFKKFPQNFKNNIKITPEKFGSTILTLSPNQTYLHTVFLMILIFTSSIPYRQCTTFVEVVQSKDPVSIPLRQCTTIQGDIRMRIWKVSIPCR